MTKWHYCTGRFDSADELLSAGLEPLGELGWEPICLEKVKTDTQAKDEWFVVFRRPAALRIRKAVLYGIGGFWLGFGGFLVVAGCCQWNLPFDASLLGLGFALVGLAFMFWDKVRS